MVKNYIHLRGIMKKNTWNIEHATHVLTLTKKDTWAITKSTENEPKQEHWEIEEHEEHITW